LPGFAFADHAKRESSRGAHAGVFVGEQRDQQRRRRRVGYLTQSERRGFANPGLFVRQGFYEGANRVASAKSAKLICSVTASIGILALQFGEQSNRRR
jgi:hypothetical protein